MTVIRSPWPETPTTGECCEGGAGFTTNRKVTF